MHGAQGICKVWACSKNANNSGRSGILVLCPASGAVAPLFYYSQPCCCFLCWLCFAMPTSTAATGSTHTNIPKGIAEPTPPTKTGRDFRSCHWGMWMGQTRFQHWQRLMTVKLLLLRQQNSWQNTCTRGSQSFFEAQQGVRRHCTSGRKTA